MVLNEGRISSFSPICKKGRSAVIVSVDTASVPALPRPLADAVNYTKHLLAGAMSAMVSRTCCAPMERVKMQMMLHQPADSALQVAGGIYQSEGIAGFWRGNGLNILRTAPFKAVNFFSFDMYRKTFTRVGGGVLSNEARLTAGALAGVTASIICFPLDVLRTRVLCSPGSDLRSHPLRMLVKIAKSEGAGALYVGIGPSLLGMVPSGAIYYWMYDLLKERRFRLVAKRKGRRPKQLDAAHALLFGAMAGCSAESLVFPLEVVRRRMQTMAADSLSRKAGMVVLRQAVMDIWAREKLKGFYAGMLPNTVQVLPSAALSYAAFEASKSLLRVKE
ncbi:hypothetical protein CVIRNUC_001321 [Coccomyxa viridis]|uniref:Mitochondrial carrier protein n=1 Tax=Coccomyxa viridis TaxID=1274662 RepID=A0AAV1HVS0_9CHLO|nr:hypothetical protein CVIRNUC_001321 [Coccomyxa viridis]